MSELDQFLETSAEEVAAPPEQQAQAVAADDPEDKGKIPAEMPAATKDESAKPDAEKHWSEAAYYDEKRKRKELQEKLEALEKSNQKQDEGPDLFVDPKGFTEGLKNDLKNTLLHERINLSRELLMETKQDYAEKEAKFVELAQANPALVSQMNSSANPAKFAYDLAKKELEKEAKLKLVEEIGDIEAFKQKLRDEILAEVKGSGASPIVKKPSLATANAAKSNNATTGTTLEDIFDR
jgi:hypothetical protein